MAMASENVMFSRNYEYEYVIITRETVFNINIMSTIMYQPFSGKIGRPYDNERYYICIIYILYI